MTGYQILVGPRTDRIITLRFDPDGPTLSATSELKVGLNPTWLTAHPTDPSLEGVVVALKFDDRGHGTVVGRIPSCGADPASLLVSTKALFAGNVRCVSILHNQICSGFPFPFRHVVFPCGANLEFTSTPLGPSSPRPWPPRPRTSSMRPTATTTTMSANPMRHRAPRCSSVALVPMWAANRVRIRTKS